MQRVNYPTLIRLVKTLNAYFEVNTILLQLLRILFSHLYLERKENNINSKINQHFSRERNSLKGRLLDKTMESGQ